MAILFKKAKKGFVPIDKRGKEVSGQVVYTKTGLKMENQEQPKKKRAPTKKSEV